MARPNTGPKLSLNPQGFWQIRWTQDGESLRLSTKTKDEREAHIFFAEWILAREKAAKSAHTVSGIIDAYLDEHVAEGVLAQQRQHDIAKLLKAEMGAMEPSDLTADVIARYKARRKTGKVNGRAVVDSTLRRELNVLVAALNHAVRQRRIKSDEVPSILLPPTPPAKDIWLNEAELETLLAAAAKTSDKRLSRLHRFVVIAAETAARKASILSLKWEQVDFAGRMIRFDADGKRQKNKRRVPVPMSSRLLALLKRAHDEKTSEWVLDSPFSIQRHFDLLCASLGGKFNAVTPHTLRHTWATLAARSGKVQLWQIAGVLGDTLQAVTRNYLHHCPDHLRGAVDYRTPVAENPQTDADQHDLTA
jgi:integrase